jgi:hypothetical protein
MYPTLKSVWTPEARQAVAASLAPVLTKYGVNLALWGDAYKEEIGALLVCGPLAWATVQAIKTDAAARGEKPEVIVSNPAQAVSLGGALVAEPVRLG